MREKKFHFLGLTEGTWRLVAASADSKMRDLRKNCPHDKVIQLIDFIVELGQIPSQAAASQRSDYQLYWR